VRTRTGGDSSGKSAARAATVGVAVRRRRSGQCAMGSVRAYAALRACGLDIYRSRSSYNAHAAGWSNTKLTGRARQLSSGA
jgi:hypothetical protein